MPDARLSGQAKKPEFPSTDEDGVTSVLSSRKTAMGATMSRVEAVLRTQICWFTWLFAIYSA